MIKDRVSELWECLYEILEEQGIAYRYSNKEKALVFALTRGLISQEEYEIMKNNTLRK